MLRIVRPYRPHHEKDIGFALRTVLHVAPIQSKIQPLYLSRARKRKIMTENLKCS